MDSVSQAALCGRVERGRVQALSQSVKAVCSILAKMETTCVTKAMARLDRVVADMAVSALY